MRQLIVLIVITESAIVGARAGDPVDDHWAFRPVVRPALPTVRNLAWVRDPIDRLILARQERVGIGPAPEADRATLLRRLSLDLTGLPPALADVDGFLADNGPALTSTASSGC